jgi:exopolyphosphatase/pppGpp-phosphohydrolase
MRAMTDDEIDAALRQPGQDPPRVLCHGDSTQAVLAWLQPDGTPAIHRLDIGPERLAHRVFRHTPPLPVEIEHAIDLVEDELMRLHGRVSRGRALQAAGTFQVVQRVVPGGQREDVEALFERLTLVSQGRPSAGDGLPQDSVFAAAALVLRECMHHLGCEALV